jgi:hypothetical protein
MMIPCGYGSGVHAVFVIVSKKNIACNGVMSEHAPLRLRKRSGLAEGIKWNTDFPEIVSRPCSYLSQPALIVRDKVF